MPESDLSYYERRLAEEQANALQAASPEAISAHRRMAEHYAARLEALRRAGQPMISSDRQAPSR
ncbi:MAG: hypothetical protein JWL96_501 [Sphingomonas bacterium]|uniref:hypothetical protein n=1 Tax=Sphingomonas bacterium TaxID=1895847 RepID=UPI00260844D1|nr:hypothetical protein [Sphingomonas bacterium]MDB5708431.1 hypothetical protein [Sphingomonas bacterium]